LRCKGIAAERWAQPAITSSHTSASTTRRDQQRRAPNRETDGAVPLKHATAKDAEKSLEEAICHASI
jgi:hypothetical protein